jgi:hypothetical protein
MPAKTLKQIQDEADRMFGKKASDEKFKWRQQQQAAAGLEVEKKTRGGVAGAYDRNKKLVSAGVTGLGYMFGGPAGAALARGAVQGLDRPGEGGIGFDVKRGLKGAAEGYGAGSALRMASAGAAKLGAKFGIGGAGAAPGAAATAAPSAAGGAGGAVGGATPYDSLVSGTGAGGAGGAAGGAGAMSRTGSLLTNPQVIAGAAGGVADVMGQRSQQRIAEQQMEQQASQFQQQFDVAEEERKRQQAQANRLAGLFMPTR